MSTPTAGRTKAGLLATSSPGGEPGRIPVLDPDDVLTLFGTRASGLSQAAQMEYSVIFSVVALPLTYLPILLVANDRAYMGADVNGTLANFLGVAYFILILVVAVAAIPLMLLTNGGQG